MTAPVRVPVELKRGSSSAGSMDRWFRLAQGVSPDGLELTCAVPEELDGPLDLRFHLPGDPEPVLCRGRAVEVRIGEGDDERAERRGLAFVGLDETTRGRITN